MSSIDFSELPPVDTMTGLRVRAHDLAVEIEAGLGVLPERALAEKPVEICPVGFPERYVQAFRGQLDTEGQCPAAGSGKGDLHVFLNSLSHSPSRGSVPPARRPTFAQ